VWPVADAAGHMTGLGLTVRDITTEVHERERGAATSEEMREINARLLLAAIREEALTEEAQAASDAKSAFLATMSHELRTPLNAIIGYGELLSDGIPGPISEAQHVQLERIRASAHHLLALIDQVLTLSRLEAGREPVNWELVSLASVLDQATTLASPLADRKRLTLRVLAPESPVTFESDAIKVTQILVNLLGNAVRFTDRGDIVMSARAEPGGVVIEVRDTGIGIAEPNLERVFDPFWQVEQVHTRRVGGSGLGLSVCRRLARLLGGDVTVTSTLGEGSTFAVRIADRRLSPAREE
jgi:signal transduction histidine kinase